MSHGLPSSRGWIGRLRPIEGAGHQKCGSQRVTYFLGDYVGLDHTGNDFLSGFGSTVGSGPSSIFVSRLEP